MVDEYANSDMIHETSPRGSVGKDMAEILMSVPHMQDTVS
jgi:hypothetical protein